MCCAIRCAAWQAHNNCTERARRPGECVSLGRNFRPNCAAYLGRGPHLVAQILCNSSSAAPGLTEISRPKLTQQRDSCQIHRILSLPLSLHNAESDRGKTGDGRYFIVAADSLFSRDRSTSESTFEVTHPITTTTTTITTYMAEIY